MKSSHEQEEDLRYHMKRLVYNEKAQCYDVPSLGGYAAPSSGNTYVYAGNRDESIAVTASMRANEKLDQVLDFMLTQRRHHCQSGAATQLPRHAKAHKGEAMKVVRISFWPPEIDSPITSIVTEESLRVSVGKYLKEMETPGAFYTFEVSETDTDSMLDQTIEAMERIDEDQAQRERNMAIMYYWTASFFPRLSEHGVHTQSKPSPLSVDQIKHVLKQLVKHPTYRHQRIIAIAEDQMVVQAQDDKIEVVGE